MPKTIHRKHLTLPKIGINGFGRTGRIVLRAAEAKGMQVVAINDPYVLVDQMAYLFKFDTTHRRFKGEIEVNQGDLFINGRRIVVTNEKEISDIRWSDANAQYIVEATNLYTSAEKAAAHIIKGRAKKVIIAAPSSDAKMLVMGVNHKDYNPREHDIVSAASDTTNCVGPLLRIIHDKYKIVEGFATTVHAVLPTQKVVDVANFKAYREGRDSLRNIIPTTTGAAKAIGKILPALDKKVDGMAFKVPIGDVSVADLVLRVEEDVDMETMCKYIRDMAGPQGKLKGILGYTEEQVVSRDFLGDRRSCIFDAKASLILNKNFVKLIAWYDNEYAYAHRITDLIHIMSDEDNKR